MGSQTPHGPWGWSGHLQGSTIFFFFNLNLGGDQSEVAEATPWPLGVIWPPPRPNEIYKHIYILVWALRVVRPPPMR
jgi:hypothetical protein